MAEWGQPLDIVGWGRRCRQSPPYLHDPPIRARMTHAVVPSRPHALYAAVNPLISTAPSH